MNIKPIKASKLIAADVQEPQKEMYGNFTSVLSYNNNSYKVRKVSDFVKISYEVATGDEKVCYRDSSMREVKRFLSLV